MLPGDPVAQVRRSLPTDGNRLEPRVPEIDEQALALARHRGLLEAGDDVAARRQAFAAEIADSVRRVALISQLAGQDSGVNLPNHLERSELQP